MQIFLCHSKPLCLQSTNKFFTFENPKVIWKVKCFAQKFLQQYFSIRYNEENKIKEGILEFVNDNSSNHLVTNGCHPEVGSVAGQQIPMKIDSSRNVRENIPKKL